MAKERKKYKELLRHKIQFTEKQELEIIAAPESTPHRILEPRRTKVIPKIPMSTWEEHFAKIYQRTQMVGPLTSTIPQDTVTPLTVQELWNAFHGCKSGKAPGPDNLTNELLMESMPKTVEIWTGIFNECIKQREIPASRRESTIQVLYKGKGPKDSPDAYRGIALECAPFKVLTKLLLNRILPQAMLHLPEEQYGFVTGRSTIQAIEKVLSVIWDATSTTGGLIYVIYVDYAKALEGVKNQY